MGMVPVRGQQRKSETTFVMSVTPRLTAVMLVTEASKMTPDQITEARRMAREWLAKHQQ